jgi:hypothetical protein
MYHRQGINGRNIGKPELDMQDKRMSKTGQHGQIWLHTHAPQRFKGEHIEIYQGLLVPGQ